MMSKKRKLPIILLIVFGLLLFFAVWYQYTYSMDVAESFEVNTSVQHQKLLIATQGSDFKDEVTKIVIDHFKNDSIAIKVVDISALETIEPSDYNALLLIHTWENWKPPSAIKTFINRTEAYKNKIVVITTSGEGSYKMVDVDAITGESKPENIKPMTQQAISKLEVLLYKTD